MAHRTKIRIESPGVNAAVVKKDRGEWKFLVLKRAAGESYSGYWGFMTGSKQGDETVAQVVARELEEETGLRPQSMWATEYTVQCYEPEYDAIWILPLIVAVASTNSPVRLAPENSEYRWLRADEARQLVSWKNLVKAIADIADELKIFPACNWVGIKA